MPRSQQIARVLLRLASCGSSMSYRTLQLGALCPRRSLGSDRDDWKEQGSSGLWGGEGRVKGLWVSGLQVYIVKTVRAFGALELWGFRALSVRVQSSGGFCLRGLGCWGLGEWLGFALRLRVWRLGVTPLSSMASGLAEFLQAKSVALL